jgi:hypothetical protein
MPDAVPLYQRIRGSIIQQRDFPNDESQQYDTQTQRAPLQIVVHFTNE